MPCLVFNKISEKLLPEYAHLLEEHYHHCGNNLSNSLEFRYKIVSLGRD